MKRTLMKFLPIAAAVLLATSCSKDDNSVAVVEEGTPIVEEVYDSNVKTITISGKVGQESLSKIGVSGSTLKFESGDKFTFGTTGADNVYGTIEITATDGSYTATVNFPSESALLDPDGFLATKGTKPTGLSSGKDNLGQAVQYAYYEVPFKVTKNTSTGKYALATTVSGKSGDILVNLQSAFIYALSPGFIKLGGAEVGVNTNLYYVIPVGVTMGSGTKVAEAGKVYKYGNEKLLPGKFTVDANGKRVQFSRGVLDFDEANDMRPSDWWGLKSDQRYDGREFGWGTWATGGLSPATTSTTNSDYTATLEGSELKSLKAAAESFIGEDWATLSRTQWNYLLNTRTTTSVRFAKVRVPDPDQKALTI